MPAEKLTTQPQYANLYPTLPHKSYSNFYDKITPMALPAFEAIAACLLFRWRPNNFSLSFTIGALILPHELNSKLKGVWQSFCELIAGTSRTIVGESRHDCMMSKFEYIMEPFEPLIKKVYDTWLENKHWIIGSFAALSFAASPQRLAITTCIYAASIGYRFARAPNLINISLLISDETKERLQTNLICNTAKSCLDLIEKVVTYEIPITEKISISIQNISLIIQDISIKIFNLIGFVILSNTCPDLFNSSFELGNYINPKFVNEVTSKIAYIWENNKILFLIVNAGMYYHARPSFLKISSLIYASYLGEKLYSNSIKNSNNIKKLPEITSSPSIYPNLTYPPSYQNLTPPPSYENPLYFVDNTFSSLALRTVEILTTCTLFKYHSIPFSLFFAHAALQESLITKIKAIVSGSSRLVLGDLRHYRMLASFNNIIEPIEPALKKVNEIWQEYRPWIVGISTGLLCAISPHRWTIAAGVYGTHLGYRFSAAPHPTHVRTLSSPRNPQDLLPKSRIQELIQTNFVYKSAKASIQLINNFLNDDLVIKIIQVSSIALFANAYPKLFGPSLAIGALFFPNRVNEMVLRVASVWDSNALFIMTINFCRFFYTLPSFLMMNTLLYSSFLGYKLYYKNGLTQKQTS